MALRRRQIRARPGDTGLYPEEGCPDDVLSSPLHMSSSSSPTGLSPTLADVCRSHPVVLGYLFGSHARGTADADSDIDVAVLADPGLSPNERLNLRFRLMRHLAEVLDHPLDQIDIIVLQDVPSLLQYNVIRTGQPVFERDPAARHTFELSVERRYDDERPYLERETTITLQRILSRTA